MTQLTEELRTNSTTCVCFLPVFLNYVSVTYRAITVIQVLQTRSVETHLHLGGTILLS